MNNFNTLFEGVWRGMLVSNFHLCLHLVARLTHFTVSLHDRVHLHMVVQICKYCPLPFRSSFLWVSVGVICLPPHPSPSESSVVLEAGGTDVASGCFIALLSGQSFP